MTATTQPRIRLLIADDSPVFRFYLKKCVAKMDGVEVAGEARDGVEALEQMAALRPDVVTLDMTMPRMNGMDTLKEMQRRFPNIPAIVLTSADEEEANLTLEALENGAFEFVLKPGHGPDGERRLIELLHPRLIEAARQSRAGAGDRAGAGAARRRPAAPGATPKPAPRAANPPRRAAPSASQPAGRPGILAIGSSTGGPTALHRVLAGLPAGFPLPIVLTQHMPANFLVSLAERLTRETPIETRVAEDGMPLAPGRALLAPGGRHMEIARQGGALVCQLNDGPSEHHCKPAVDPMFRSLAALAPRLSTLAVVLTGMGADGAAGALAIREAGGQVIAQDEATSVVWGMPGATVKLGAAHQVLPLEAIAPAILEAAGARPGAIPAREASHASAAV